MVDVGEKDNSSRQAIARGEIQMSGETLSLIVHGSAEKGDVLGTARLAGIMAAKNDSLLFSVSQGIRQTRISYICSGN